MLLGEKAILHSHIVSHIKGETQTGTKWKRLTIDGKTDIKHAISEHGEIYSFKSNKLLATQDGGKYVRFSDGHGMKLYSIEKLKRENFPELSEGDPAEWHCIEINGEQTEYEIARSGEVRRKNNRRPVKQGTRSGCSIVWLRHKGKTVTANTKKLLEQAFAAE